MATTNYSLPTLESTALFDLVTDYNALANATDSALASVAGLIPTETITEMQGQISSLQTLTGSQGTQITTLQSQMTAANGNISTLQSGLKTTNTNIGTLQSGLQTANNNISKNTSDIATLNKAFVLNGTQYNGVNIHANASSQSFINVMVNTGATVINVYGRCTFSSSVSKTKIPGTNYYGIKTLIQIPQITKAHVFDCSGISSVNNQGVVSGTGVFAIGSDGYIYLLYASSNTASQSNTILTIINSVKFIGTPAPFSDSGE